MPRTTAKDMHIASIDGTSILNRFESISYDYRNSEVEVGSPLADYKRKQTVFQEVSVSATIQEDLASAAGTRVTGQDLVITLNGDDLCPILKGLNIKLNNDVSDEKGACSAFALNQVTDSDLAIELELYTNTEDAEVFLALIADQDYSNHIVAISANLANGTTLAGNFKISSVSDEIGAGSTNTRKVSLAGHDTGSGAYPTTPSSANSLINNLIVNPRQIVAVSLAADNANHAQLDFNAVYESLDISIPQSGVMTGSMTLKSRGEITVTTN